MTSFITNRLANIFSASTHKAFASLILLACFLCVASSLAAISTTSSPQPAASGQSRTPGGQLTPIPSQLSNFSTLSRPSLITQTAAIAFMSLMPFIVMILTSFVKIVVVLSLLRNALGVQQAPPNQVINGVAFLLSIYVMYPTGVKMYDAAQNVIERQNVPETLMSPTSAQYVLEIASAAREPLRDFLRTNSLVKHHRIFFRTIYRLLPEEHKADLKPDDFMVLVPSFITTQLKSAFEIGVLIYIPFFVIDLVVSNILLAMGMMMLSPVTISMPLKLFLLVMLDGWTLLIQGLVATFR